MILLSTAAAIESGNSFNSLGDRYFSQGKYDKAESSYSKAMTMYLSVSSSSLSVDGRRCYSEEYTNSLNNLATSQRAQGKILDAITSYEELLSLQPQQQASEATDGSSDSAAALMTATELGSLYRYTMNYSKAEPLYLHCYACAVRMYGDDHINALMSKNNLANLLTDQVSSER